MTNQRGVAHIFLLLILLVGIGLGVYLTFQTQIFKPKAQTTSHIIVNGLDNSTVDPLKVRPSSVNIQIQEIDWGGR